MAPFEWDSAVALQDAYDALKKDNKKTREELVAAKERADANAADVAAADRQVAALQKEVNEGRAALATTRQDLKDQKQAAEATYGDLTKAYDDLERERNANQELMKAKDAAEAIAQEYGLKIDEQEEQIRHLEGEVNAANERSAAIDELEARYDEVEAELNDLRTDAADRDRTILVKDARIAHLETQYQKALEGKLNAEAAASDSAQHTDPPPVFTSADASLQDELDATSDYSDDASTFLQLEHSHIFEIANITPATPTLTFDAVKATSIVPIAPECSYDIVRSVEIAPVEPTEASKRATSTQTDDAIVAERKSHTAAAQTIISNPPLRKTPTHTTFSIRPILAVHDKFDMGTRTAPTIEITPELTVVPVVAPAQKKGHFSSSMLATISALALLMFLYIFTQSQASNGYGYGSRGRYSTGAFGHGRYLFGIIPVGFDIGHDWFSEQVCRTTSTAVATFEDWIGITPTPLY